MEPIRIPIAGRERDSEWYLSTHTLDRSYVIEVVLDKAGEMLVIYDPESALEYLQANIDEHGE